MYIPILKQIGYFFETIPQFVKPVHTETFPNFLVKMFWTLIYSVKLETYHQPNSVFLENEWSNLAT